MWIDASGSGGSGQEGGERRFPKFTELATSEKGSLELSLVGTSAP